jgi:radical SAM superfamily enzyme YgiQ (UPF0313 family)
LKFVGRKATCPPLGLVTIAQLLPADWERRLVDMNVQPLDDTDLAWADIVLLSAMTVQQDAVRAILARCKAAGVPVVAGGPLFTMEPEDYPDPEHLVLNEAEITLPRFLDDLRHGQAERCYATDDYADLATTPLPDWGLLDLDAYDSMAIQFSRGCPFACDFCNITSLLGRRPRLKSSAQIIAELDDLYARGWRRAIFFVDDNFIGNRAILKQDLLPALITWRRGKRGVPFNTEVSINLADDAELTALMVEAGFDKVFIGIETPDEESLAECRKGQNLRRNMLADVRKLQHAGLRVQAGFIVGFDHDTPAIFERQIAFIQQSGIVTAMVGLLQAPPGTELYARLKAEGRLLGKAMGNNVDLATNVLPRMGMEALQEGYRALMGHIYSSRPYYERVKTFLTEYRLPRVRLPLDWVSIRALFRSMVELGIRDADRRYYWDLLFWTLRRRPELFSMAVTLAIYGHHFKTITQASILGS